MAGISFASQNAINGGYSGYNDNSAASYARGLMSGSSGFQNKQFELLKTQYENDIAQQNKDYMTNLYNMGAGTSNERNSWLSDASGGTFSRNNTMSPGTLDSINTMSSAVDYPNMLRAIAYAQQQAHQAEASRYGSGGNWWDIGSDISELLKAYSANYSNLLRQGL